MNSEGNQATGAARAREPNNGVTSFENGIDETYDNFVELKYRKPENLATAALARGIGYFSLGLGLAEIFMPARVGELAGVSRSHRSMLPLLGLREIAHGVGILRNAKPTTAVWTRVGGDALDLAFLGVSFAADDSNKRRLTGAVAAVLGVTALDVACAQKLSSQNWRDADPNPKAPTTLGQTSGRRSV